MRDVLAGETPNDDVDLIAEFAAVQVAYVADPNRRVLQTLLVHPRQEDSRSVGIPLDVTHNASVSPDELAGEFESPDAREHG
jgi:hypothetical protein